MLTDLRQAINNRIGDSRGITKAQLLNMASEYKKAGLTCDAELLWKMASPGVFKAVDFNNDSFISKSELKEIVCLYPDIEELNYEDLMLLGPSVPIIRAEDKIPDSFVKGIRDGVQAIPTGVRDFIFNPENGNSGYKIFVWHRLLTDLYPKWEKELYYATGCTSAEEKRIDISAQLRRKYKNDAVEIYAFPKHNTYHELGHAFDNMLFELYFTGEIPETTDEYYSYHSGKFENAYNADLEELKKKAADGQISKEEAGRILGSRYVKETESVSGKEETFAEIFTMIMLDFEIDDSWTNDYKRTKNFLSYFPRSKQVVLDQIEFVSPGFKEEFSKSASN